MHARLEEGEIFISKKTLYHLLKKYRPTDLQRADRNTVLTMDWLVSWLAAALLLVEIIL